MIPLVSGQFYLILPYYGKIAYICDVDMRTQDDLQIEPVFSQKMDSDQDGGS